jgi:hypothetical protein
MIPVALIFHPVINALIICAMAIPQLISFFFLSIGQYEQSLLVFWMIGCFCEIIKKYIHISSIYIYK